MKYVKQLTIRKAYRVAILLAILFFITITTLGLYADYTHQLIIKSERNRHESLHTAYELLQISNELTKMARLYARTGDVKYKNYFFNILAIREGIVTRPQNYSPLYWDYVIGDIKPVTTANAANITAHVKQLNFSIRELELLKKAERRTSELTLFAQKAFNLLPSSQSSPSDVVKGREQAYKLLHSTEYLEIKANILKTIDELQNTVDLRTQEEMNSLEDRQQLILYVFQGLILLAFICCYFMYRYATRRVIQPIDQLASQARQVAEGNYATRNDISSKNELEILAKIVNDMCESIESDIDEREHLSQLLQESEDRFRNAIDYAPIGMAIKSLQGKWLQANYALCEILGYSKAEIANLTAKDIAHPDDLDAEKAQEQRLISGEIKLYQQENRYLHKDGHVVWVLLSASLISDAEGRPMNLISQIHDIGPRKRSEKAMKKLHEQMSATLVELQSREHENILLNKMNEMLHTCQNSEEAYSIINLTAKELFPDLNGGLIIYDKTNDKLQVVRQWGEDQILQLSFTTSDCWALRNGNIYVVDDPENALLCHHYLSAPKGGYINLPLIVRGEMIGLLDLNSSFTTISGKQQQLAITFSENIKLALANLNLREALRYQAIRDGLTGLFNRRYLDETLSRELEQIKRNHRNLALAMLDIDGFKHFNDEFGHDAGDEVLKHVGKLLQQTIRSGDMACRYGGEEFVVIMTDANLDDAQRRVEHICDAIKKCSLNFQGNLLPQLTLSAGIVSAPMHGTNAEKLLGAADDALYAAKMAGKNRVVVYTE